MRAQNDVGQRSSSLQRMCLLLCVFLLFTFVAVVLFWVPKAYAHTNTYSLAGNVAARRTRTSLVPTLTDTPSPTPTTPAPTPTDTPAPTPTTTILTPTPTNTPTPVPTNTPTPTPTNTPTPIPTPTNTPVPTPTDTPIPTATTPIAPTSTPTPKATPTAIVPPTSTPAVGGVPGGSHLTPTPTPPILKVTATPKSSGLPPSATNAVPSPTVDTNTPYRNTATPDHDNGNMLMPTAPEIGIGTSIIGAAALVGWYLWRRRQDSLLVANHAHAVPLSQFDTPSSMSYAQTVASNSGIGIMQGNEGGYQANMGNMGTLPATPFSSQIVPNDANMSLESIMRQAQQGLFALPGKEEYS